MQSPRGQSITLIGTAHISERSNAQVTRLIEQLQPQAVLIEMDEDRLHRIGIPSIDSLAPMPVVKSGTAIAIPTTATTEQQPWQQPLVVLQQVFTRMGSLVSRRMLTRMYSAASSDGIVPGGEFLAAIRAAQACSATLVLGDRSSVTTIQRGLLLALQRGNIWSLIQRFQEASDDNGVDALEAQLRADHPDWGDTQVQAAIVEKMKLDAEFRNRMMSKLQENVPEFAQAFLHERDYIMGEAIRQILDRGDISVVVSVVGLAHVEGIENHLQAVFANKPAPLLVQLDNDKYV